MKYLKKEVILKVNLLLVDDVIKNALEEDISYGDITTDSIVSQNKTGEVEIIAKEDGIICGTNIFIRVFEILGGAEAKFNVTDGDKITKGQLIGNVHGNVRTLLTGERVALNFIQRLSGISTLTNKFVTELQGTNTKILDTRKTTPGLRMLEKYAVQIGGGCNHRFNLTDGVLIKDNHIDAAGGITNAVKLVKKNASFVRKIEVEAETLNQVNEALEAGADIIMLDNMDVETMKKAVKIIDGRAITEASGNASLINIHEIASCNVDFISVGSLTYSYKAMDLSMKHLRIL